MNFKALSSQAITIFIKIFGVAINYFKTSGSKYIAAFLIASLLTMNVIGLVSSYKAHKAINELKATYETHIEEYQRKMEDMEARFIEVESLIVVEEDMSDGAHDEYLENNPSTSKPTDSSKPSNTITNTSSKVKIDPSRPIFNLSENDLFIAYSMVAGESGGEPYEGMVAVAQCIMNGMIRSGYTVEQVRVNYQYSGWHNIDSFCESAPEAGQKVKDAVHAVFMNQAVVTNENIVWFLNPKLSSKNAWHYTQKHVDTIGNHMFFAPKS